MTGEWLISRATDPGRTVDAMHGGTGSVGVRFMNFTAASTPAKFLLFDIPAGASEGAHRHRHDDPHEPPYDECYFVVAGEGLMTIEGQAVPLGTGDAVFVPVGVEHGIANTSPEAMLRIFLTYIDRTGCGSAHS